MTGHLPLNQPFYQKNWKPCDVEQNRKRSKRNKIWKAPNYKRIYRRSLTFLFDSVIYGHGLSLPVY